MLLMLSVSFAIYFFFQKIQKKVVVTFTTFTDVFSEPHISRLTITNKRDNTLAIWSAYATIYQDIKIELDTFDAPLILKPYETISLTLPKYSALSMGNDIYEPNYDFENTKIYLDIGSELLLCQSESKKDILDSYRRVTKHTFTFSGHVYSKDVVYILAYVYKNKPYTAFISTHGIIGNEWNFAPSHLGNDVSANSIKSMLLHFGYNKLFSSILCYKVVFPNTKLEFQMLSNGEFS